MNTIIFLAIAGVVILASSFLKIYKWLLPLSLLVCVVAFVINASTLNVIGSFYHNMITIDRFSKVFSGLLIFQCFMVFILCGFYYSKEIEHLADIYSLFIFSLIGAIIMVSYSNLVMFFVGLEMMSIPLYILAASHRTDLLSSEAGLKYFIFGSFQTCLLILGIAFIYGSANSFDANEIAQYVQSHSGNLPALFTMGVILVLCAFAFKVAAFPFHFWAPDVYQGAPTAVTAFMATVVKTAAIVSLLRLVIIIFAGIHEVWFNTLLIFAALTLIVGNITALYQNSFKRLLAYSGISNAGYLLIAIVAFNKNSESIIFYYALVYSIATIASFSIFIAVKEQLGIDELENFKGTYVKNPLLTAALTVSMLSLAGIPPVAGFFAKYYLFVNAVSEGFIWLVIIAVITSIIGAFYYLRIVSYLFNRKEVVGNPIEISPAYQVVLYFSIAALILIGLFPNVILALIK
jgi:NADH-quinone oxidoreductase subunit N